ncbi:MAG: hypothetical protein JWR37_5895, partial [Mycobacterium sp.]|nr:hypothetical protein [Mycobacterium sp.]
TMCFIMRNWRTTIWVPPKRSFTMPVQTTWLYGRTSQNKALLSKVGCVGRFFQVLQAPEGGD